MSSALGVALVALGGVLSGSFTVPMQFCSSWPWEACWYATLFVILRTKSLLLVLQRQQL